MPVVATSLVFETLTTRPSLAWKASGSEFLGYLAGVCGMCPQVHVSVLWLYVICPCLNGG
jgi:hypothetical protein